MKPGGPNHLSPQMQTALQLISALCDERITPQQASELEAMVLADNEIRNLYLRLMHLDAGLHQYASALGNLSDAQSDLGGDADENSGSRMDETMVMRAMPEPDPEGADTLNEGEERFQPRSVLDDVPTRQERSFLPPHLKGGLAALVLLGLGIAAYVLVSIKITPPKSSVAISVPSKPAIVQVDVPTVPVPPPPPIAMVDVTARPVWNPIGMPAPNGSFIAAGLLSLKSGDVQLTLRGGGKLVVEGPAELEFVSDNHISLHSGKIVATKPGGGLVVKCPNGSVTDLGTQFGISVGADGAAEVAVFEGRISAALNSAAATHSVKPMLLAGGQAAVFTDKSIAVSPEGAVPQRYVCNLLNGNVTTLDVTDLVSGGDGTTSRRGIGIDQNTGAIGQLAAGGVSSSDGNYHPVKGYPVVDGAFIPDGKKGEVIVDSIGDKYDFAPSGNATYNFIFTGGKIPWPLDGETFSAILDQIDYSTPGHGFIFMHANNALTLDLDAVRRIFPDREIRNFHCRVGNSCIKPQDPLTARNALNISAATVYVLVNGACRYTHEPFSNRDGGFSVEVPILPGDRFVTLATTDAGRANHHDWILWADAKLDLTSRN